jgi:hypothetical protein
VRRDNCWPLKEDDESGDGRWLRGSPIDVVIGDEATRCTLTNGYPLCKRCELTLGGGSDDDEVTPTSFGGGVGGDDERTGELGAETFQPPIEESSIGRTCWSGLKRPSGPLEGGRLCC